MSDIYLIPKSLPCPLCGIHEDVAFVTKTFSKTHRIPDMCYYRCGTCNKFSSFKEWFGKYFGLIKDIKDD